ncbi:MAG: SnoaL-like protein [Bacteroidota bacterium]|nr:SnoaL-like protein [Bacteroidota bacterium]
MKHILIFSAMLILLVSCEQKNEPAYTDKDKQEVISTVETNLNSYCSHNLQGVLDTYAKIPEVAAYGSIYQESAIGYEKVKEIYKNDMSAPYQLVMRKFDNHRVIFIGEAANCVSDLKISFIHDSIDTKITARMTSLLKKLGGKWLLVQTVFQTFPTSK